jgi:hypothetical protein
MEDVIRNIFSQELTAFRVNASFSYVLRHGRDNIYRFFYGSHGENCLFRPAATVRDRTTTEAVLSRFTNLDVTEFVSQGRESSAWVFHQFTNLNLYIYPLKVHEHSLAPISTTSWRVLAFNLYPSIFFFFF